MHALSDREIGVSNLGRTEKGGKLAARYRERTEVHDDRGTRHGCRADQSNLAQTQGTSKVSSLAGIDECIIDEHAAYVFLLHQVIEDGLRVPSRARTEQPDEVGPTVRRDSGQRFFRVGSDDTAATAWMFR